MAEEKKFKLDKELEEFRRIMEPPSTFEEGFNWMSFMGALFVGLLMVPGAVYMSLMAGEGIGDTARWVTVILFIEIARRAQRNLKKAEVFVLFYMVGAAMAMPFSGLHWNQFFIRSDSALAFGLADQLPLWFAPPPSSESYVKRTFLHWDWLPVIGMVIFSTVVSRINFMILGYGFFKIASDIERLPFPMAPVGAAGTVALAEDMDEKAAEDREKNWRWRVFSIGGALGLAFGCVYLLLPILSGALTGSPITIIPIPFVDWTSKTAAILPAVPTGIDLNLSHIIWGMVMPFYAVVGKIAGLGITMALNPILYKFQIMQSWLPGDDTIATSFKTNIDFYFSFSMGIALAVALVGLFKVLGTLSAKRRKEMAAGTELTPDYLKQRGDIPNWIVIGTYFVFTMAYILFSGWLIDWHRGVMAVMLLFGFVYTPFISYVTARMEGIAGMQVNIPFVHQASLILSGYQGVKVWFLPIPMANYGGGDVIFYRQCELTGTKFSSIWKAQFILLPIILISSILYMSYIWGLAEIPSTAYPYAQKMWELNAANSCIMFSATMGEYSIFEQAFRWSYVFAGTGTGLALFGLLSWLSAPIFLTYGMIQGIGSMPHALILQFMGALIGRQVFHKKMGLRWRQYCPVLAAGFGCGMGLVATLGVGITFLAKAIIQMPF